MNVEVHARRGDGSRRLRGEVGAQPLGFKKVWLRRLAPCGRRSIADRLCPRRDSDAIRAPAANEQRTQTAITIATVAMGVTSSASRPKSLSVGVTA
jgi:hypothetical protein